MDLHTLLANLAQQLPIDVIWAVGIVLALRRWRRHPQASLLILIAFGLELVRSVGGTLAWYWLNLEMKGADRASIELGIIKLGIVHNVSWGLDIIAWTLVLIALFRWRHLPHLPRRLLGHDGQYLPEGFEAMEG